VRLSVISTKSFFLLLKRKWWIIETQFGSIYNICGGINMTELERGYLAGIIDGEGSITLTKDK